MITSQRVDKTMYKHQNLPSAEFSDPLSNSIPVAEKLSNSKKEKITKEEKKIRSKIEPDYRDNLDTFFTLLLKNFSSKERYLLLQKILSMKWSNPNEDFESQHTDLTNENQSDDELKKSLDYESFLWEFNNWKNYFLAEETNKQP